MLYRLSTDLVFALHLGFVLFAMLGGLLVLRYPKMLWLHLPALAWGIIVEWADLICPLTHLENYLRQHSGAAGYTGSFIEHYITLLLYPGELPITLRYVLGTALLGLNLLVYSYVLFRRGRHSFGRCRQRDR